MLRGFGSREGRSRKPKKDRRQKNPIQLVLNNSGSSAPVYGEHLRLHQRGLRSFYSIVTHATLSPIDDGSGRFIFVLPLKRPPRPFD